MVARFRETDEATSVADGRARFLDIIRGAVPGGKAREVSYSIFFAKKIGT